MNYASESRYTRVMQKNGVMTTLASTSTALLSACWGGQILLTPEVIQISELPENTTLEDFGKHTLKDLGEPQQIFGLTHPQLPLREFPALRTLSQQNHNLPTMPTPFLGRERELEEIRAHITETPCRLLTLAGSGGMGKTRLSLQAGGASIDFFPDGVFFVPLAPIESPDFLITSIAEALKFNFYEEKDAAEQLFDFLKPKKLLLILDNFEHVINGTPLVAELLQEAPLLKLIVTSRERLQIQGEWVYPIFGLDYPEAETAKDFESFGAVQLFLEGATRANPQYTLAESDRTPIAQICDLVQGMPLGIELASAWMGMLSPDEISFEIQKNFDFLETNLYGVPERHKSLRAVFEYSWQLIDEQKRLVFMKLAEFQGGFTRAAAEEIAGASIRALENLLNKSLIRVDSNKRYEIVEALRTFASEKLAENADLADQIKHSQERYYLDLLESLENELKGEAQKETLTAIGTEIENIRKAWHIACEYRQITDIARALTSLMLFYEMRSWFTEGEEQCRHVALMLRDSRDETPSIKQLLARVLTRQGAFSHRLGDSESARAAFSESRKLLSDSDDLFEVALLQNNLGNLHHTQGEDDLALKAHSESLRLRDLLGDSWSIATSLSNLGVLEARRGELKRAQALFEKSLEYRKSISDRFGIATSLNNLGVLTSQLGEFEHARELHSKSLEIRREIDDQKGITESLSNLGVVADALGKYDDSISLYEESLAISEEIGDKYAAARTLNNLGYAAYNLGEYPYAIEFCRKALELNREIRNRLGIVLSLSGLANSESELEQFESAEKHFFEALELAVENSSREESLEILLGIGILHARMDKISQADRILSAIEDDPNAAENLKESARSMRIGMQSGAEPTSENEKFHGIDHLITEILGLDQDG